MPIEPNGQTRPAEAMGNSVHFAQVVAGEVENTMRNHSAKRVGSLVGSKVREENSVVAQWLEMAERPAAARWA